MLEVNDEVHDAVNDEVLAEERQLCCVRLRRQQQWRNPTDKHQPLLVPGRARLRLALVYISSKRCDKQT